MKHLIRAIAIFSLAGATLPMLGCASLSTQPLVGAARHVPFDGIVLAPNEKITLNATTVSRREYLCSNGTVLQCERFGFKLLCRCPVLAGY